MNMIEKAIEVATVAHDKQYRKASNIPYISHPYSVGVLLLQAGCRKEVVAAGILHDVVEDTSVTLEDIRHTFGNDVASIVEGCSEPDKSLSWEERKKHTIDMLKSASFHIKATVCADKLHNVRTIIQSYEEQGEAVWERFSRGKEKQKWYYESVYKSLTESLSAEEKKFPLFEQLRRELSKLFNT